jgi:SAM-dependent methyltransferase
MNLTSEQQVQEEQYIFPYHYLDLFCEDYKYLYYLSYLNYLHVVRDLIPQQKVVLDVGCGDGRFCFELQKTNKTAKIVGLDYSKRAIEFAKIFNPKVEFFVKDLKELDLPYKFDYITFIETLEHINPHDIPLILTNLAHHLKDDGKLIITVPSKNIPVSKKHYQHFDPQSIANTLTPTFKVETIIGNSKLGPQRIIFNILQIIGIFIYPLRNKISLVRKLYSFLGNYYHKNIGRANPKKCTRLIVVCTKVTSHK